MRYEGVTFLTTKTLISCLVLICVVATAGCSGGRRGTQTAETGTPWFCQMNETRDDWECVQDAELARHPRPERLPTDEPEPMPSPPPTIVPTVSFEQAAPAIDDTTSENGSTTEAATPTAAAAAAVVETEPDDPVPEPEDLMSLSGDMFAVQLVAVANETLADDFITEHELDDALTLLLARETDLYYVVLLGIFESYADAQFAADHRSATLRDVEPWIRPLASVQKGVLAARALIAGSE